MAEIERRAAPGASGQPGLEWRSGPNGATRILRGVAACYYVPGNAATEYPMDGRTVERIARGAFSRAIRERDDVRALLNHDDNLILGRTRAGTLRLRETERGLEYEIDLPDTQAGRDVAESVRRGDITGSSFAFRLETERWSDLGDGRQCRTLTAVRLLDVSPVVYPAYTGTEAAMRARAAASRRAAPARSDRYDPFEDDEYPTAEERARTRREAAARLARVRVLEFEASR